MRYDPHLSYVAPAKPRAELWRTAAGVLTIFVAGVALYQLSFAILSTLAGPAATQQFVDATSFDRDTAVATLYTLLTFGFFAIGLAMVVTGFHARPVATLFGPRATAIHDFLKVLVAVGALYLLLAAILPHDRELLRNPGMTARQWIVLLPVSMVALLVQAGTEEAVFRGYLQQQIAARFPGGPLWLILPTALFALLHLSPQDAGTNAPLFALWAAAFGLAAADLTARTGTIGAALGFHMANNVSAVLFVSLAGPGSGLALYVLPLAADDPALGATLLPELAATFCGWLAARLALRV